MQKIGSRIVKIKKKLSGWGVPLAIFLIALLLSAAWRFTPLQLYADPEFLRQVSSELRGKWWTLPILMITYILAHSILFPNTVLNTAIILTFGGLTGWTYAMSGSLVSAAVFFCLGYHFGEEKLQSIQSERFKKIRRLLLKGGLGAVIAVRLVPIAPYPVVNLSAGAIQIKFWHFIVGTFIAHLPGTLTMTFFGEQLQDVIREPGVKNVATLVAIVFFGAIIIWLFKKYALKQLNNNK